MAEAKAIPIDETADRLGLTDLKHAGRELVGPCPSCGGRDRFSINPDRGLYNCRSCGGGDGLKLVQLVLGCDFPAALAWLVGEADASLDPEESRRRQARFARQAREREAQAEREREKAIGLAREIWVQSDPVRRGGVRDYLGLRGITPAMLPELPPCLRFHAALRYTVKEGPDWITIHEGPAMVAAVCRPDGQLIGVHRTWIDLARPGGKAEIAHKGEIQPAKKMLGSKKGGSIRLSGHEGRHTVLVMAEGIETTLSAQVSHPVAGAVYWSGVDLGNMAGRRKPVRNPATGKVSTHLSEVPDLTDDDAFYPPPWTERLIYVQDGDSAPGPTRAKLIAGLRRAMWRQPRLKAQIVHAGADVDLNDVLKGPGRAAP